MELLRSDYKAELYAHEMREKVMVWWIFLVTATFILTVMEFYKNIIIRLMLNYNVFLVVPNCV